MAHIDHDPWTDPAFEQAVRDTAYFLWEQDGRPHDREQEYWFQALEKCLRQRQSDAELQRSPVEDTDEQLDDNIDDLGRPANNPKGPRLDQPV